MNPSHPNPVPRLLPDEPLPPYTFVPGRFPHPESDPAGHSNGRKRERVEFDPQHWTTSRPYLFGLDLFNAGYYWESHVEFESLWNAAGRQGAVADFFKGLIHLAAAGVKHLEGVPAGVTGHARRAAALFRQVAPAAAAHDGRFLGMQLGDLIALSEAIDQRGWPTQTSGRCSPNLREEVGAVIRALLAAK